MSNFTTIPRLFNNNFASGLKELQISVHLDKSQGWTSCYMNIWTGEEINNFDPGFPCPNQHCNVTKKEIILFQTITDPIPNNLNITLKCFNGRMFETFWMWQSKGMRKLLCLYVLKVNLIPYCFLAS